MRRSLLHWAGAVNRPRPPRDRAGYSHTRATTESPSSRPQSALFVNFDSVYTGGLDGSAFARHNGRGQP